MPSILSEMYFNMMMEIFTIDSVNVKSPMIHKKDGKSRYEWRIVDGLYNPYQEGMKRPENVIKK